MQLCPDQMWAVVYCQLWKTVNCLVVPSLTNNWHGNNSICQPSVVRVRGEVCVQVCVQRWGGSAHNSILLLCIVCMTIYGSAWYSRCVDMSRMCEIASTEESLLCMYDSMQSYTHPCDLRDYCNLLMTCCPHSYSYIKYTLLCAGIFWLHNVSVCL